MIQMDEIGTEWIGQAVRVCERDKTYREKHCERSIDRPNRKRIKMFYHDMPPHTFSTMANTITTSL